MRGRHQCQNKSDNVSVKLVQGYRQHRLHEAEAARVAGVGVGVPHARAILYDAWYVGTCDHVSELQSMGGDVRYHTMVHTLAGTTTPVVGRLRALSYL